MSGGILMNNPIKIGKVSAVYPERCTAKVLFEDIDKVSSELPIVVRGSQNTKDYWLPSIGEQVLCVFLQGTLTRAGFIIGSLFNDEDVPPVQDKDKRHIKFEDGTYLEYDIKNKILTIDCKGQIQINAANDVHVTGDVFADGISLKNHTHNAPTGGSTSAPIGGL